MRFHKFDASARMLTRPRLNSPAAVMANAALAVSELARLRAALVQVRDNPAKGAEVAAEALKRRYE